jgi:hypothetical protein
MSVSTFNFHDLVGIRIESEDDDALDFFEREYFYAKDSFPLEAKEIGLRWRKGNSLWPSKSDYRFHVHKLFARWSYKIAFLEDGVDIDAFGNHIAIPMIHHMMVHPALRYLSSKCGTLMLHGSAVVKGKQSLIFTGKGGMGKTTISSLVLMLGGVDWQLHADDYVFLARGPKTQAYMTRSHLYRDLIRWVPHVRSILTPQERLRLNFFGYLRAITKDGVKWPLRIGAARLWPGHTIAREAQLAALILLRRTDIRRPVLKRIDFKDLPLDELIGMNFFEARHFIQLVESSPGDVVPSCWLDQWKDRERTLLGDVLRNASIYTLELPLQSGGSTPYGQEVLDLVTSLLEDGRSDGSDA